MAFAVLAQYTLLHTQLPDYYLLHPDTLHPYTINPRWPSQYRLAGLNPLRRLNHLFPNTTFMGRHNVCLD